MPASLGCIEFKCLLKIQASKEDIKFIEGNNKFGYVTDITGYSEKLIIVAYSKGVINVIQKKDSLKYLGALLHKSGRIESELGCRLGMAKSEFCTLS